MARHLVGPPIGGDGLASTTGDGTTVGAMPGSSSQAPTRTAVTLSPRTGPATGSVDAPPPTPLTPEERALLASAERTLIDDHRLLEGAELQALATMGDGALTALAALAHQVRLAWCGPMVEIEGILSAKTGGCPEDCHFCSQSSRFDTPVKATPFLDRDEVLAAAAETAGLGASEFCIVLAVRGPDERTLSRILELVPQIYETTGLQVAVSAGILTEDQARRLAEGGVHRYNHNLETARSFFPHVVTSHRWEERVETCRLVRSYGMELCCGALIGMGETDEQRVELMLELRDLDPSEVPLNFLIPQPGTPFADRPVMDAWTAVRWIALFRLALPGVILRYGGGREIALGDLQAMGMTSGINALIVGNYLTTLGRSAHDDLRMLGDLRMPIGALTAAF